MKNRFIYQLGRKLVFHASYREMYEIVEDYTQFTEDGSVSEKPQDIINSLDESGHRALITYIVLGVLCISNVWLFMYIDTHRLSSYMEFVIPLVLSVLFPLIVMIAIGNKITLLSKLYFSMKKPKILIYSMNILICLVAPIFCGIKIIYTDIGSIQYIHFIQNILGIVAVLGIIPFLYFILTRGASYYLGLCSSYILLCTLFQVN